MGKGLVDVGLASRADSLVRCPITEAVSFQFICPSAEEECGRGPGGAGTLLLGAGYGYQAVIVLSFDSVPVDSQVVVDSAWVRLTAARPLEGAPTDVTVHALLDTLIEANVLFGDSLDYDPVPLPVIPAYDDDGLRIDLTQVVAEWYVNESLRGLALVSHDPGPSFGFFRSGELESVLDDPSMRPTLSVHRHFEGDTTSAISGFYPAHDTYLLWWDPSADSLSAAEDRIAIGKGLATRSLLKADVSCISMEATINRARLILHVDTNQSFFDSLDTRAHSVKEDWSGSATEFETLSSGGGWVGSDSAVVDVTTLVQVWTAGMVENHGFLLKTYGELDNVDFVRFFGPSYSEDLRPVLIIEYSVPPLPWHRQ
ncbi:MAG: DNRLRE domain-containing protein [Candidatus Eisenbacteria sp.]|nr:DNRLRE domain-containing protein [Candidatus Eisenbacteria bacterium]